MALIAGALMSALWGCVAAPPAPDPAQTVLVRIDLSDQEMRVHLDGRRAHDWPVSTARAGKCTPVGTYRPQRLVRMHYSTLYGGAPMPWSIFFHGNYAIHGTTEVARLGQPASAGCVRLHPENAERLFGYVQEAGFAETRIVIRE